MTSTPLEAIVVGGSAGSLEVVTKMLAALPREFPLPIAVVIHLPSNKRSYLAEALGNRCALRVKEAEDKEAFLGGVVYVAPPDYHLLVERDAGNKPRALALSVDEPVCFSRPAIDVLFETAADAYASALAGVLLTGASDDGARGMLKIANAGGVPIVQSPESAAVRTMPEAALRLVSAARVLSSSEIGPFLAKLAGSRSMTMEAV